MRPITDYDNLITDRMVEFTDQAPEHLRGKRIPMMCDQYGTIRFSDLVDLTNGTTLFRSERNSVETSPETYDYNQLIKMGMLKSWYPYTELELIIVVNKTEDIQNPLVKLVNGEQHTISSEDILITEDGRNIYDLTREECKNVNPSNVYLNVKKVLAWFEEHGLPVTEEAVLHNFHAWQKDMKSGFLDKVNGYHLFSPCAHNPLSFERMTLHPSCEEWQTTYEI